MKRILLFICFVACLIAMVATTVVAHPGRTDSQGGHTDQSTGEYHFHHGYSAHDHYDMNGDGVVDCPYDFDDKTNHDGGGGYGYTRPTEEVVKETEEETEDSKLSEYQKRYERDQKKKKISKILRTVLGICYIPLIWLIFYFICIKK